MRQPALRPAAAGRRLEMKSEQIVLNQSRNVTLTTYLLEAGGEFGNIPKRPAVLILPGGGYQFCSDREADPVACPYLAAGFDAFILRYSVRKDAVWPNPLDDYEQAMQLIRSKAEEWNIYQDKIAVIGFSAGGHLAACAATMSVNRPNAAILGYPVTIGDDVRSCNVTAPDTISAVDKNTCPCFVFATRTDNLVPIRNSIHFVDALEQNDISFECHIYSHGPHGFSTCDASVQSYDTVIPQRVRSWVPDSIAWLKDIFGEFGNGCLTQPVCAKRSNGNMDDYLSVDCTFGYLMSKPEAAAVLTPILDKLKKAAASQNDDQNSQSMDPGAMDPAAMAVLTQRMKLRDLLSFGRAPAEAIEQIDQLLRKIANT